MIRIYTSPACASCRKAKHWLKENHIPYVEKNIITTLLHKEELKELLERSENGTDDIISKRSKVFKEKNVDLDHMTINELIDFIQTNPSILKRPIIMDERRFQVGYNSEEIRSFIPRELRQVATCIYEDEECLPFKQALLEAKKIHD